MLTKDLNHFQKIYNYFARNSIKLKSEKKNLSFFRKWSIIIIYMEREIYALF